MQDLVKNKMDNSIWNTPENNYRIRQGFGPEIAVGKTEKCNLYNPSKPNEEIPTSDNITLTEINTGKKITVPKELLEPRKGDLID